MSPLSVACASTVDTERAPASAPGQSDPGESEQSKGIPKDPTTELIFGVDAERFELEGFFFTSFAIEVKVDGVVAASEQLTPARRLGLPHETRVIAPRDKPDALVEIVVRGLVGQNELVTRRATAHFVKGKSLLAYVRLEVRCNTFPTLGTKNLGGPTCVKPHETCIGAKCTSDELVDLPSYRADWATVRPSVCGAGANGSITLGTGQDTMAALSDDDTVQVECGPQGGHHVWMALAMRDLAQSGTTTTFSATQPGGLAVPSSAYPYGFSPAANGTCELVAIRFQLDTGGVNIKDLLGKPLDLKVVATDTAGRTATATRRVNVAAARLGGGACQPLH